MSFENWTIEDLFTRCMDCDEMTLEMDREEFAALRRKIAELRQAGNSPVIPEWIPVSERMPDENGAYQVWNGKHVGAVPFFFGSFQCINPEQVTHWMPLPAAPQEVK